MAVLRPKLGDPSAYWTVLRASRILSSASLCNVNSLSYGNNSLILLTAEGGALQGNKKPRADHAHGFLLSIGQEPADPDRLETKGPWAVYPWSSKPAYLTPAVDVLWSWVKRDSSTPAPITARSLITSTTS